VLPPDGSAPEGPIEWKAAWSPTTGWITVGVPQVPVPTPAATTQPTGMQAGVPPKK
jgi:hypothetical protein